MVKDIYEKWLNHPNLDPSYKEVLEQMDEGQINDAFYTTIEFGTAGMRGLLGPGTNRINLHTIRKANVGFAEYICANGEDAMKRGVAIGYDNRHMSKEFAMDSAKVLATYNIASYVFESLRPTPELFVILTALEVSWLPLLIIRRNTTDISCMMKKDVSWCLHWHSRLSTE